MRLILATALALATVPALAQMPMTQPGAPDAARVTAGTYTVDANHTQVTWTLNHLGFSLLSGQFGAQGGTLMLDPKNPGAAKVDVTFATDQLTATSAMFVSHLKGADWFDVAKNPTARFVSTSVAVTGGSAKITGDLTIKGVTKPVTLDATFIGAGTSPMNKKANIGFRATGSINRSDFGLSRAVPMVSDKVDLVINAAFVAA